MCWFDLLFLTSSVIPIHIDYACLCLFHSLSNGDIFVSFICYTWWSLVFLFLSTHLWISYLPYFSTRFDCKWTGTLLYPYNFSSTLLLNHFDQELSELLFVCPFCIFMWYYWISMSLFFIFKLFSEVNVPLEYWHFLSLSIFAHLWVLILITVSFQGYY